MILRRADLDSLVVSTGVTSRLNRVASPLGGAYGMVRSSGTLWHNGWDLYARPGTACLAVCSGTVVQVDAIGKDSGYGKWLSMELHASEATELAGRLGVQRLFAFYAHLDAVHVSKGKVAEGEVIARTGSSGNASDTPPHLHFELRTEPIPKKGVPASFDPGELLGRHFESCRSDDSARVRAMYL